MIEGVLLSKAPETADGPVDLPRREMLPRLALLEHRLIRGENGQKVDMVGHDHEVCQAIAVPVGVTQAVVDVLRQFRPAQQTRAVQCIQVLAPAARNKVAESTLLWHRPLTDLRLPVGAGNVDSPAAQPGL